MKTRLGPTALSVHRRAFLGRAAQGIGAVALASLLDPSLLRAQAQPSRETLPALTLPRRAKRVIWLTMAGGPSQFETFDYKPELEKMHDQPMPESFTKGQPIAQLQGAKLKCLRPQFKFRKHGQSGQEIADILPNIAKIADEICIIRSMKTDQINHDPAHTLMNTGEEEMVTLFSIHGPIEYIGAGGATIFTETAETKLSKYINYCQEKGIPLAPIVD